MSDEESQVEVAATETPKKGSKPKKDPKPKKAPAVPAKPKVWGPTPIDHLTKPQLRDIRDTLHILSDITRVKILAFVDGDASVTEVCERTEMPQPAVSHHLMLMKHAGLVWSDRNGKKRNYTRTERGELVLAAFVSISEAFSD